MTPCRRRDDGQTSAEYLGLLVVVALLVGALTTSGGPVGRAVADGLVSTVCRIAGGDCVATGSAEGSPPPRVVESQEAGTAGPARTGGDPVDGGGSAGEGGAARPLHVADLPEGATPGEVAAFFAALDEEERRRLVAEDPERIGALDGAPLELRFAANALLIGSRFVGASVPLDADDDPASVVGSAAGWFAEEGLEVVETRTEPPQQGVHARDADGGTYSLRILDGSGRIAAGANTPCLPEARLAPGGADAADAGTEADEEQLHAVLAEVADAVGAGASGGAVPTDCPGGLAVQRSLDLDDEDEAAAVYARLVDHLGGLGRPVEGTNPDGTRFVTVERGDTVVAGIHVPGSTSVILTAERGCEEE